MKKPDFRKPHEILQYSHEHNERVRIEQLKIDSIERGLKFYGFNDLQKVKEVDVVLSIFTLCFCLLDQMATFRYNRASQIENFTKEYLPKDYNGKSLQAIRHKLLHNLSFVEEYAMVRKTPIAHLKVEKGSLILNAENFIDDIGIALDKYLAELKDEKNSEIRTNAFNSLRLSGGVISQTEFEIQIEGE
jgi:hypothetical protein